MKAFAFVAFTSALLLAAMLCSSFGYADSPLSPPSRKTIWSANRKFYAIMDPDSQVTTIYHAAQDGKGEKIWSMYGWFRVASLADDGKHLITGYDGINLLPIDYNKHQIMLYFFNRGELINHITLDRLIQDFSKLRRSVSHYYWGNFIGFDNGGNYVVETVEGRRIRFVPAKGEPIFDIIKM